MKNWDRVKISHNVFPMSKLDFQFYWLFCKSSRSSGGNDDGVGHIESKSKKMHFPSLSLSFDLFFSLSLCQESKNFFILFNFDRLVQFF